MDLSKRCQENDHQGCQKQDCQCGCHTPWIEGLSEFQIDDLNDVELTIGSFLIECRGRILSDADAEPVGVSADGAIESEMKEAMMATVGGKCTDTSTGEVRIFPAGIYKLTTRGIEKIGDIGEDT